MKILLDENLPHQLRLEMPGHEVFTVAYMSWSGIENGALLREAASAGFDAVVTNDRGLEYRQNLKSIPVAVVVVLAGANTIEAIRPISPPAIRFTKPPSIATRIVSLMTTPKELAFDESYAVDLSNGKDELMRLKVGLVASMLPARS